MVIFHSYVSLPEGNWVSSWVAGISASENWHSSAGPCGHLKRGESREASLMSPETSMAWFCKKHQCQCQVPNIIPTNIYKYHKWLNQIMSNPHKTIWTNMNMFCHCLSISSVHRVHRFTAPPEWFVSLCCSSRRSWDPSPPGTVAPCHGEIHWGPKYTQRLKPGP